MVELVEKKCLWVCVTVRGPFGMLVTGRRYHDDVSCSWEMLQGHDYWLERGQRILPTSTWYRRNWPVYWQFLVETHMLFITGVLD